MTVNFVSQADTAFASISAMPSHQPGDVLVMFARTSSTAVTRPPGWTVLQSTPWTDTGGEFVVAWARATSSSETSGTWGSSSVNLSLAVCRPDSPNMIIDSSVVAYNTAFSPWPDLTAPAAGNLFLRSALGNVTNTGWTSVGTSTRRILYASGDGLASAVGTNNKSAANPGATVAIATSPSTSGQFFAFF